MVKLIIEIPKDDYDIIKNDGLYSTFSAEMKRWGLEAIRNGTPLPRGHGRIADMDEAIKCIKDVEGDDAIWAISLIEWACGKRIIIEADKEVEK